MSAGHGWAGELAFTVGGLALLVAHYWHRRTAVSVFAGLVLVVAPKFIPASPRTTPAPPALAALVAGSAVVASGLTLPAQSSLDWARLSRARFPVTLEGDVALPPLPNDVSAGIALSDPRLTVGGHTIAGIGSQQCCRGLGAIGAASLVPTVPTPPLRPPSRCVRRRAARRHRAAARTARGRPRRRHGDLRRPPAGRRAAVEARGRVPDGPLSRRDRRSRPAARDGVPARGPVPAADRRHRAAISFFEADAGRHHVSSLSPAFRQQPLEFGRDGQDWAQGEKWSGRFKLLIQRVGSGADRSAAAHRGIAAARPGTNHAVGDRRARARGEAALAGGARRCLTNIRRDRRRSGAASSASGDSTCSASACWSRLSSASSCCAPRSSNGSCISRRWQRTDGSAATSGSFEFRDTGWGALAGDGHHHGDSRPGRSPRRRSRVLADPADLHLAARDREADAARRRVRRGAGTHQRRSTRLLRRAADCVPRRDGADRRHRRLDRRAMLGPRHRDAHAATVPGERRRRHRRRCDAGVGPSCPICRRSRGLRSPLATPGSAVLALDWQRVELHGWLGALVATAVGLAIMAVHYRHRRLPATGVALLALIAAPIVIPSRADLQPAAPELTVRVAERIRLDKPRLSLSQARASTERSAVIGCSAGAARVAAGCHRVARLRNQQLRGPGGLVTPSFATTCCDDAFAAATLLGRHRRSGPADTGPAQPGRYFLP